MPARTLRKIVIISLGDSDALRVVIARVKPGSGFISHSTSAGIDLLSHGHMELQVQLPFPSHLQFELHAHIPSQVQETFTRGGLNTAAPPIANFSKLRISV